MPQLKSRLFAALGAVVVVGSLAACSPESVLENALGDGSGVDVDTDDGGVVITDDEGNSFTSGGGLPEGFPSDVPVLDLEVLLGGSSSQDGVESFYVTMSGSGGQDLYDDALSELESAGYTADDTSVVQGDDGSFLAWAQLSGPHDVLLSVSGDASETAITYTVSN